MFCSQCGTPAASAAKFCAHCGAAIVNPTASASPPLPSGVVQPASSLIGQSNQVHSGFRDPEKLTKWLKIFLYTSIIMDAIALCLGYLEYQLLADLKHGVHTSLASAMAAAEASDRRQQTISLFQLGAIVIIAILFLKWIYRANYNVRQLGASGLHFTPGWSIGWYFIPVANLWKPYQAMKEIWKASKNPDDWQHQSVDSILPWWWFFFIVSSILDNRSLSMSLSATELTELISANLVTLTSNIFSILLTLIAITLVGRIYEMQMAHVHSRT